MDHRPRIETDGQGNWTASWSSYNGEFDENCRYSIKVAHLTLGGEDCNTNSYPDSCDLTDGTSQDCNANSVPDECDVVSGTSNDCSDDGNGIPDECEPDCNGNTLADSCDIAVGASSDCNGNSVPDECDTDCNSNGIPDECEPDCTGNTLADSCDIADWYGKDYYAKSLGADPTGPASGTHCVLRGGSCFTYAVTCRCADLHPGRVVARSYDGLGFRVVAEIP